MNLSPTLNRQITTEELFCIVKSLAIKDSDGEVNLTPIAEAFGKRIDKWKQSQADFLEEFSITQNGVTGILKIKQGGNNKIQGTYTKFPEVFINLLQYCDTRIAVRMNKIIVELFTNGSVSLVPKLPQTFSEALKLAYEQSLIIEEQTKLIKEKTEQLDESKEWYSIKRVAKITKKTWQSFNWKMLKNESAAMEIDVKKVFDANFPQGVNIYHVDVWTTIYPELTDLLIKK